eukprot:GHVU01184958.1.p1 GENE.GHVU01184958.1~~GHVU01184958.1.p1  ORF type:complete len:396 (-),score=59.29 GHVU01184958.1:197-1384(-)
MATEFARRVILQKLELENSKEGKRFLEGAAGIITDDGIKGVQDVLGNEAALKFALTCRNDSAFAKEEVSAFLRAVGHDPLWFTRLRSEKTKKLLTLLAKDNLFLSNLALWVTAGDVCPQVAAWVVVKAAVLLSREAGEREWNQLQSTGRTIRSSNGASAYSARMVQRHVLDRPLGGGLLGLRAAESEVNADDMLMSEFTTRVYNTHNNDLENFKLIHILPTGEEVLAKQPFLPSKGDKIMNMDQLADKHFRWMREDLLGPIRDTSRLLRRNGADRKMPQNARLVKRLDAWTFNGVLFRNLEWDRRQGGCSAEVSFFHNMLREFKCDNQPNEMRKLWNNWKLYWERNASLLQQGALVAFVNDEDDIVFFAGVAEGNSPPRRTSKYRSSKAALLWLR